MYEVRVKLGIREKHRLLRTGWLILTLLLVGLMVYVLLPTQNLTFILLSSYIVAVILFVIYEAILLKELQMEKSKDRFLIHNSWIQLYIGSLSLFTAALSFAFSAIIGLSAEAALLIFIGLTMLALLSTYSYIEGLVKERLPSK